MAVEFKESQDILGFHVENVVDIPEINSVIIELKHNKTGAQVMHIANDDPENVFNLLFQTIPINSNGVAHILEHSVLCGSKKFPIRDPFFSMTRRSLNTFMNAMTGADFTCYPAASQISKDFYNLLEVYLDAAFNPILNKKCFLQEGWRLEFTEPQNEKSPLIYKGIVFNEMKGALSSPTQRLVEELNQALYPDLTYGFNSGGDPAAIPDLTYEEFLEFHNSSYHPSRCIFFFYGNMPLKGHLEFITKQVLDHVEPLPQLPPLPRQARYKAPVTKHAHYPIGSDEDPQDKTMITLGWLTCHVLEQKDFLALSILEMILLDTDVSPLKKAILKSGLCSQVSSYVEGDVSEVPFVIIMQGANPENGEPLEKLILETLEKIVREGIPTNLLESALHQLELSRSEITGDGYPYGLSLFFRSALFKQHQGKPEYGLMIHTLFNDLRESIAKNPRYLEDLIEKYLLQNPHRVLLTLEPSKTQTKEELAQERAKLDEIQSKLTEDEIKEIKDQATRLEEYQLSAQDEDIDILPKISLDDVPKEARDFALDNQKHGHLEVFHHDTFTNGILYADMIYNLPNLPEVYLPYVRIFAMLMSQMGCGGRTYEENLDYIQTHTGDVGGALCLNNLAFDYSQFIPSLHIKGKALHRKTDKLLALFRDMIVSLDFDDIPRLKEVLLQHFTTLETHFTQHAMKYAINLGASGLNLSSKITNDWFGINHFNLMKNLVSDFDLYVLDLVEKMKWLQQHLLGLADPHLVITCTSDVYEEIVQNKFYGLLDVPHQTYDSWKGDYMVPIVPSQARLIASQVAFTSKVLPTIPYVHPHSPALNLASHIFDNATLHPRIREQGGAYGSGAVNNSLSGSFYFYAFRDPNISRSLDAFQESLELIKNNEFDESRLEEAKLEEIQKLDNPVPPGSRGDLAYSWMKEGRSLEIRQKYRDRILSLNKHEVQEAVFEHLAPQFENGIEIVFTGKDLLKKENALLNEKGKHPFEILS
ncbi:MAG: hypothetical protein K940chlam3_00695 [Chlamydiae bacterium]|nr:hypothetical protein [Chlamydiota bacterium]